MIPSRTEPPSAREPAGASQVDSALDLGTIAIAVAWLGKLVPQALAARLQTDECFHATVSRDIAAHGTLPARIDGLYGGFSYFYPPLYHVVGAIAFRAGGLDGFRMANVAVAAAVLIVAAAGAARLAGRSAARWAACLCMATGFLALHAVRMYVEELSTLLVVAALLRTAALVRRPTPREGVVAGFLAGLAIVAKLSALVLPPAFVIAAAVFAWRGRRDAARALVVAALVAVAVAGPFFVRNAVLFGSPIYPAFGRDLDAFVLALNVRHFTPTATALWADTARCTGAAIGGAVLLAVVLAFRTRRGVTEAVLVLLAAAFAFAAPLQSLVEARHLLPLMIAAGALASASLAASLAPHPRARRALDAVLLLLAAWAVVGMPHWRTVEDLDEPLAMAPVFAAVRAHVPAGETVLARETYDTFWYAGRNANWPVPFGQPDVPIAMFLTSDPDSVAAAMERHGLRWALVTDEPVPGPFDGADWPESFTSAVARLEAQGRAREVWSSDDATLWRFGR